MKLRNKLIPIVAFATAATAVAPIATSCGRTTSAIEGVLDITSPYTPTIAKAGYVEETTVEETADFYLNHLVENPEILQQDIWQYESKRLPSRINWMEECYVNSNGNIVHTEGVKQNTVTNVTALVNASNISVTRHEAIIDAVKTQFYTVSMDLGYAFQFTATSLSTEPRLQLTYSFNFQTSYKDIPLYFYKKKNSETGEAEWHLSINVYDQAIEPLLDQVPGWSLGYGYDVKWEADISTHGLSEKFSDGYAKSDTFTRRSQIIKATQEAAEEWAEEEPEEGGGELVNAKKSSTVISALADMYMDVVPYYLSNVTVPTDLLDPISNLLTCNAVLSGEDNDVVSFNENQYLEFFSLQNEKALDLSKRADQIKFYAYDDNSQDFVDKFYYEATDIDDGYGNIAGLGDDYENDDEKNTTTIADLAYVDDSHGLAFKTLDALGYNPYEWSSGNTYHIYVPANTCYKVEWYENGKLIGTTGELYIPEQITINVTLVSE